MILENAYFFSVKNEVLVQKLYTPYSSRESRSGTNGCCTSTSTTGSSTPEPFLCKSTEYEVANMMWSEVQNNILFSGMTDDHCYTDDGDHDDYEDDFEIDFQLDTDGRISLLSHTPSIPVAVNDTITNELSKLDDSNNDSNYAVINKEKTIDHEIQLTNQATIESNTIENIAENCNTSIRKKSSQLCYDTNVVETKLRFPPTNTNNKNYHKIQLVDNPTITEATKSSSEKIELPQPIEENYIETNTATEKEIWDELFYDCEICDNGLMPRTFWIGCNDVPRCSLEQIAYDIFLYHTKALGSEYYNPSKSGAEWWVQIRPSPDKVGRYSMHSDTTNNEIDMTKDGISFHWDKDEELRLLCEGSTYVHPHLSTVTYFTSIGSPTLVINKRIHNLTGEWINDNINEQSSSLEAFITYPCQGKHLSFDGRYLHAAPKDLLFNGNDVACSSSDDNSRDITAFTSKKEERSNRRITFLVNIWLNYIPLKTKRFPDTMVDKLSGFIINDTNEITANKADDKEITEMVKNQRVGLSFEKYPSTATQNPKTQSVDQTSKDEISSSIKRRRLDQVDGTNFDPPFRVHQVDVDVSQQEVQKDVQYSIVDDSKTKHYYTTPIQTYKWPMGDCTSNEFVHADIPIFPFQQASRSQGNIQIRYKIFPKQPEQEDKSSSTTKKTVVPVVEPKIVEFTNNETEQSSRIGVYLHRYS
jgi:hypothetical protein